MIRYLFWMVFLFGSSEAGLFQNIVMKLDVFRGYCEGVGLLPSGLENITLKTDKNRKTVIDALYVFRKTLDSKYEEVIKIQMCTTKESPDSCVFFKTLKFPDVCPILLAKNQIWSTFFSNIKPKLTCPLKKGVFVMKDAYFDTSNMPIPVDVKKYFKIHVENYDLKDNKMVLCLELEGQFFPLKH